MILLPDGEHDVIIITVVQRATGRVTVTFADASDRQAVASLVEGHWAYRRLLRAVGPADLPEQLAGRKLRIRVERNHEGFATVTPLRTIPEADL
jgi:hypothetical protein